MLADFVTESRKLPRRCRLSFCIVTIILLLFFFGAQYLIQTLHHESYLLNLLPPRKKAGIVPPLTSYPFTALLSDIFVVGTLIDYFFHFSFNYLQRNLCLFVAAYTLYRLIVTSIRLWVSHGFVVLVLRFTLFRNSWSVHQFTCPSNLFSGNLVGLFLVTNFIRYLYVWLYHVDKNSGSISLSF